MEQKLEKEKIKKIIINEDGYLASPYISNATIEKEISEEEGEPTQNFPAGYNGRFINNQLILEPLLTPEIIKTRRQIECFDIIDNRSQLGYNRLTEAQKAELDVGYQAWLDAPETLIVPNTPNGLK